MERGWIAAARAAGPMLALILAGCAGPRQAPPDEPSAPAPQSEAVTPGQPSRAAGKEDPAARKRQPRPAKPPETAPAPVARPDVPAVKPEVAAAPKAGAPVDPANNKKDSVAAPAPRPAPPAAKPAAKPEPAPAPRPAALDIAALEKRLKETSAIGFMTKLALKNQVDELLERFRAHYEGRIKTTFTQLRQPYDMLIIKVLTLLQDGDPSLAKAVAESREAIWAILTDPGKFKNL